MFLCVLKFALLNCVKLPCLLYLSIDAKIIFEELQLTPILFWISWISRNSKRTSEFADILKPQSVIFVPSILHILFLLFLLW